MFKRLSIFAVLALALSFGSSAHAKDRTKESAFQTGGRRAILAAHGRIDGARSRSDIPAIMSYIADDFHFYSIARIVQDRPTYERIQTNFARFSDGKRPTNLRVQTRVNNWQWRGPDAVIYSTMEFGASGNGHAMSGTIRQREYWGKTARGWQLRQLVEIMAQLTMDGETVEM